MKGIEKRCILIVDDDTAMLRALEKVLRSEGAAVVRAEWGGDAIEILTRRKKSIDLVITDLRMPFVSGMTVVYGIHKIFPALPIIVLTAFGTPNLEEECRKQGAAALFEKPLNTPQLLTAIESVLAPQPVD